MFIVCERKNIKFPEEKKRPITKEIYFTIKIKEKILLPKGKVASDDQPQMKFKVIQNTFQKALLKVHFKVTKSNVQMFSSKTETYLR